MALFNRVSHIVFAVRFLAFSQPLINEILRIFHFSYKSSCNLSFFKIRKICAYVSAFHHSTAKGPSTANSERLLGTIGQGTDFSAQAPCLVPFSLSFYPVARIVSTPIPSRQITTKYGVIIRLTRQFRVQVKCLRQVKTSGCTVVTTLLTRHPSLIKACRGVFSTS